MKQNRIFTLLWGIGLLAAFALWTALIQLVNVKPLGQNGTDIGFAALNCWFHALTGVHMSLYTITDWAGLVPIVICMGFGVLGLVQLIQRKSLLKVDKDIMVLGAYYVMVIFCYLIFEMLPINYRPILIAGRLEASYPSSTTLLIACVMPTLTEQLDRRLKSVVTKRSIKVLTVVFSAFMVIGRLVSGVHWFTDIVGAMLLSGGLFCIYKSCVMLCVKAEESKWNLEKNCRNCAKAED